MPSYSEVGAGTARSVRMRIDKVRFRFGIHDPLRVIQPVVAGEHVAHGDGRQVVRHAFKTEELKGDEQGGDRAVGYAAEHARHAAGCSEGHRSEEHTSELQSR